MEATAGRNPSLTWRSILHGRAALGEGLIWRIGDGAAVNIWHDKWIPSNAGHIVTSLREQHTVSKVADLIDHTSRKWKWELLEQVFNEQDRVAIRGIPIAIIPTRDFHAWSLEQKGLFSVRSLYKHLMEERRGVTNSHSRQDSNGEFLEVWRAIWSVPVPPKINAFCWRVAHQILPTRVGLRKRGMEVEEECVMCSQGQETCVHALWECHRAQQLWSEVATRNGMTFQPPSNTETLPWLSANLANKSETEKILFATTLWSLWNERNNTLFERDGRTVNAQVEAIRKLTQEFISVNLERKRPHVPVSTSGEKGWSRPSPSWHKINTDAAFRKEGGKLGLGCVIRNEDGEITVAKSIPLELNLDPLLGEAWAVKEGLLLAQGKGLQCVMVESDCLNLVNLIFSGGSDFSHVGPLIRDIKDLMSSFRQCQLYHVCREANSLAHQCAKLALKINTEKGWVSLHPDVFVSLLSLQDYRPDE